MKETRMRAVFGILGLAAAGFLASSVSAVGCGSDNKTTGTGGSTSGRGGGAGTQGQAGTTGTGGSNSGGSGGGGGGTTAAGCQLSDTAPGDTGAAGYVIADFMTTDAGAPVLPIGGTFVYPNPGGPVATVSGGAWHITATTTSMASPQYWGAGIYFNGNQAGTDCVDAIAHNGVSFDISGTVAGTGCTVQFSINDSEHSDMTQVNAQTGLPDPKAGGPGGSYAPQAQLTTITTTPTPVSIPFMGAGAPANGSPATGIDRGKLTGVQWQFTTAPSGTCMVDITIDNVKFY